MSDEEVGKQPAGDGKNLPPDVPGAGRSRDEVPGNAPIEEVKDKFRNILDESTGEGRMSAKVIDKNGNTKQHVENIRIKGIGSVEARPFEENGSQRWSLKRKDKLPHNKKDKLG